MPNSNLFDIPLFAIVRWKLPTIAASCPEVAIQAAREHPATACWLKRLEDPQTVGEFADEFSHDLVDVSGDEEFAQSHWFHAAELGNNLSCQRFELRILDFLRISDLEFRALSPGN